MCHSHDFASLTLGLFLPLTALAAQQVLKIEPWKDGRLTLRHGEFRTEIDLRSKISGCPEVALWPGEETNNTSNYFLMDSRMTPKGIYGVLAASAWSDCHQVDLNRSNTDWTLFWVNLDRNLKLREVRHVVVASSYQGDRVLKNSESWKATPFVMEKGALHVEFLENLRGQSSPVVLHTLDYDGTRPESGFVMTATNQARIPLPNEVTADPAMEKMRPPRLMDFTEADVAEVWKHPFFKEQQASNASNSWISCDYSSRDELPSQGQLPKLAQQFGFNDSLCAIINTSPLLRPSRLSFLPSKLSREFIRYVPVGYPGSSASSSFADGARSRLSVAVGHSLLDAEPDLAFELGSDSFVSYENPQNNQSFFTAQEVMRGDINGDGIEDLGVVTHAGSGGTWSTGGLNFFTRRTADGLLEALDLSQPTFGRVLAFTQGASALSYSARRQMREKADLAIKGNDECSAIATSRMKETLREIREKGAYDLAATAGACYLSRSPCKKGAEQLEANLWMWSDALLDSFKAGDVAYCLEMALYARDEGFLAEKLRKSKAYAAFLFSREKCRAALCTQKGPLYVNGRDVCS